MEDFEELFAITITNSAKRKFDFVAFEKEFEDLGENLASAILFEIIAAFANEEKSEIISIKLFDELLLTGIAWELDEINKFLIGKEEILKVEIYTTQMASKMINDGIDPLVVLNFINQMLN